MILAMTVAVVIAMVFLTATAINIATSIITFVTTDSTYIFYW